MWIDVRLLHDANSMKSIGATDPVLNMLGVEEDSVEIHGDPVHLFLDPGDIGVDCLFRVDASYVCAIELNCCRCIRIKSSDMVRPSFM